MNINMAGKMTRLKIVEFIEEYRKNRYYSPSYREIRDGCDISSTSVVAYHLAVLEEEGVIERDPFIPRSVRFC
jgi:repressor LexA